MKQYPWRTARLAGVRETTGLSTDWIEDFRKKRPEGIPGSTKVLYNLSLIQDYLVNGDSPAHARAVEKYIASLPSSDAA